MDIKVFEDYKYEIKENKEISILKYTGDCEEVIIPSTIEGMPVIEVNASLIGDCGFSNSDKLKK